MSQYTCSSFGEEYRPVRLRRVVLGYGQGRPEDAGFKFCNNLNYRLAEVLRRYSDSKATLVFCTTRKDTSTAGMSSISS